MFETYQVHNLETKLTPEIGNALPDLEVVVPCYMHSKHYNAQNTTPLTLKTGEPGKEYSLNNVFV